MAINDSFSSLVNEISQEVFKNVQQQINDTIVATVSQRVTDALNGSLVGDIVASKINSNHLTILDGVIPGSGINTESLKITGDNIRGGTVRQFASTGIEDMATECRLTILDIGTIFENTLYAPQIEIKGNAVIDGDLLIKGVIPKETQTYQNLVADVGSIAEATYDRVFATLQTQSLDIAKLTIGQRSIIEGDTLTTAVVNSNLRRVGVLQDLQTSGETLLSETLYSSNKRVGINTMDPNMALSIWDEEVDISIGKRSQGVAQVTTRAGTMILGINNQNNITLTADGNVSVEQIKIGRMQFGTSVTPPTVDLAKGTVIFNENPSLGGPLGWVSLGDARWANFGIID